MRWSKTAFRIFTRQTNCSPKRNRFWARTPREISCPNGAKFYELVRHFDWTLALDLRPSAVAVLLPPFPAGSLACPTEPGAFRVAPGLFANWPVPRVHAPSTEIATIYTEASVFYGACDLD
jgi:hypothetical protein